QSPKTKLLQNNYLCGMARWMGIDYGTKKTGIAVTDPLKIITTALDTVPTVDLFEYLADYFQKEEVEVVVIGEPLHMDGTPMKQHQNIVGFSRKLQKLYPEKEVVFQDERYSSMEAKQIILNSGAKKKKRRDKTLVDKISAALILEYYMKAKGLF
ncbi:MAG: Holliday junction resolvase RuvX, partial [Saprospiraceae bacterium]